MAERDDEYPKMIETETRGQFTVARNPKEALDSSLKSLGRLTDQIKHEDPVLAALMAEPESIAELRRASFQALLDGRREEARAMIGMIVKYDAQVLTKALKENGPQIEQEESGD